MPKMNRILLNDKRIEAARAQPGQTVSALNDAIVPGLVLRVYHTGRRTFFVWYRDKATRKPRWKQITDPTLTRQEYPFLTLARARELAREVLQAVGEGRDPGQSRAAAAAATAAAQTRTFQALRLEFVADAIARKLKSAAHYERNLRTRMAALDDRPVVDLTRQEIRMPIDAMTKRGVPVYANRVLAAVRAALNYAVDKDWIAVNPVGRVSGNDERPRTRVLSDAEIRKYWAHLDAPPSSATDRRRNHWPLLAAWCRLRLVLLSRSNEVLGMQWTQLENLDGRRPVWIIPDTKNGRPLLIPLSPLAVEILKALRKLQGDPVWVFAGIRSARDRRNVFAGAGLTDFELKDARRTAATNLGKLGVDEFFISRCLNHTRRGQVTAIYNQWQYEPEKRNALNQWATHLRGIVRPLRLVRKRGAA